MDRPNPKDSYKIRVPKNATKAEIEKFMKEFSKKWNKPTLSCKITKNQCGTDTWMVGRPCKCNNCQKYLRSQPLDERFPPTEPPSKPDQA